MKLGDVVEVTWSDAHGAGGWTDTVDVLVDSGPVGIRSLGILTVNAKDHVLLVQSVDESGDRIDNFISIPRVNIKKVRVLR